MFPKFRSSVARQGTQSWLNVISVDELKSQKIIIGVVEVLRNRSLGEESMAFHEMDLTFLEFFVAIPPVVS